jgi:hypothetical protein
LYTRIVFLMLDRLEEMNASIDQVRKQVSLYFDDDDAGDLFMSILKDKIKALVNDPNLKDKIKEKQMELHSVGSEQVNPSQSSSAALNEASGR